MTIRHSFATVLAAVLLASVTYTAPAYCAQDAKLYDASGRYQGRVTSGDNGLTKAYDRSGSYQGKAVRQGKAVKLYDKSGRYVGRVNTR